MILIMQMMKIQKFSAILIEVWIVTKKQHTMSTMSLMIGIFGVKLQLNDESKPLGEEGKILFMWPDDQ